MSCSRFAGLNNLNADWIYSLYKINTSGKAIYLFLKYVYLFNDVASLFIKHSLSTAVLQFGLCKWAPIPSYMYGLHTYI